MSPLAKLNQGYSFVADQDGRGITSVEQVKPGDRVEISVTDGVIRAEVFDSRKEEEWQKQQKQKTIEEVFQELDNLAVKLEDSETSLEDSFRFYKEGMELLKYCSDKLDTVEKKMLQMDEDGTLREF